MGEPRKIPQVYTLEYTIPFDSVDSTIKNILADQQTTLFRIELLNITVQGVQAVDVGMPWTLRVKGGWTNEQFLAVSFLPQTVNPNPNTQQVVFYHVIPIALNASPTTFIDFEKPKFLLKDKPFNSSNCLEQPKIVSAVDGVTTPFFTVATLCLRFTCMKDQYNLPASENLAWYLEKMSW